MEVGIEEPTSHDVKEVYARFGLAYYHSEVLHRGLCNYYSLAQLPPDGRTTRPRVEEHLKTAEETTLGQLVLKLESILPIPLFRRLQVAAERRNFIAHYFWFERIHLVKTVPGIEALLQELADDTDLFHELDMEVQSLSEPLVKRMGLPPGVYERELELALQGKPVLPLMKQRKLKKQETIVRIFTAKTTDGRLSTMFFETEDEVLWQLCDSGLGWCIHDKPKETWEAHSELSHFLPVKINPRPAVTAPWNFDLQFGTRAVLSVRPVKIPGQILYKITVLQIPKKLRT